MAPIFSNVPIKTPSIWAKSDEVTSHGVLRKIVRLASLSAAIDRAPCKAASDKIIVFGEGA